MAIIKEKIIIDTYKTESGKSPFDEWLAKLDSRVRFTVEARLYRISRGNFGHCDSIPKSGGLWEIKFLDGPGYRIYYRKIGEASIMLLCAGDKRSQDKDIEKAKMCWKDNELRGVLNHESKKKEPYRHDKL